MPRRRPQTASLTAAILALCLHAVLFWPGAALGAEGNGRLAFLGLPGGEGALSAEQREALAWARNHFTVEYLPFADLAASPEVIDGFDAAWWHETEGPEALDSAAPGADALRNFVEAGGGLLLTGFATGFVVALGVESNPPDAVSREPMVTSDWGLSQRTESPAFRGLPTTMALVSGGLNAENIVSWWTDPGAFSGTWLADTEWNGGIVAMGEYHHGAGRCVVVGTGAYQWLFPGQLNGNRGNLERLTFNTLRDLGAQPGGNLIAYWAFDEGEGSTTLEEVGATATDIRNRFGRPEWAPGAGGTALRFDGFSSFVDVPGGLANEPLDELTVEFWAAPRAFPYDSEAAFINQHDGPAGFFFGLNTHGFFNFSLGTEGGWHGAFSPFAIPRNRWVHLAGVYRRGHGIDLYMDGERIAENRFDGGAFTPAPGASLLIGRHNVGRSFGIFPLAKFNGLLDEVKLHRRALDIEEVRFSHRSGHPAPAEVLPAPDRFAHDLQRPMFHPIPPGDWTNEPHGLIYWHGKYHVFYQENPNGPYFGNQHWGHIHSNDLTNWVAMPNPIWPQPGPDQNGTWSGDAIIHDDRLFIAYTSNDRGQSQSIAWTDDPEARQFTKFHGNPVIPALPPNPCDGITGFRDPELFRHGGWIYMIIGSGCPGIGGNLQLYRSTDMIHWDYRGIMYERGTEYGEMWEMPQFIPIGDNRWALFINPLPHPRPIYWFGRFENERFVPEFEDARRWDVGPHVLSPEFAYDGQGRIWGMGVVTEDRFSEDQLNAGWANLFSLPRILEVAPSGDIFLQRPAPELQSLRGFRVTRSNFDVAPGQTGFFPEFQARQLEIRALVNMQDANRFGVVVRRAPAGEATPISYTRSSNLLTVDRRASSLANSVGKWIVNANHFLDPGQNLELRIFVDRSVVEIFANNKTVLTTRIYPTRADALGIDLFASGGTARVLQFDAWQMGENAGPVPSPTPTPTPAPPDSGAWVAY